MKKFQAHTFFFISQTLEGWINDLAKHNENSEVTAFEKSNFVSGAPAVIAGLRDTGLEFSVQQVERIKATLATKRITYREYRELLRTLQDRIHDEFSDLLFLSIPKVKAPYYENEELFGADVKNKYPSAAFEIKEAGNCFALERSTACVMHLMRTLEVALHAIAAGLGIPNPITGSNRNWGNILRKIKDEIDNKNGTNPPTWARVKSFFENAYTHLNAVRVSWRNRTMHIENTYGEDEAEDILNAVKGLMRHLATRLDETGAITP